MQQPIRYYIQKAGERPVVRTVPVSVQHCAEQRAPQMAAANAASEPRIDAERGRGVARIRDAIRRGTAR